MKVIPKGHSNGFLQTDIEKPETASVVILCVEEHEFEVLLERALASWRTPKWQWSMIALAVVFPLVLTMRTVWNDPAAIGALVSIGIAYLVFSLGMTFGRALRPRPTQEQIQEFNRNLLSYGKCSDFISESRSIANNLTMPERSSEEHSPMKNGAVPQFAVVDRASMLGIEQNIRAIVQASRPEKGERPVAILRTSTGEREVHDSVVNCVECGTSLASGGIRSPCENCGSALCDSCADALTSKVPDASKFTLCRSCKGV